MKIFFKGKLDYHKSIEEMENLVEKIATGEEEEQIWLVEYDNLYTIGTGENSELNEINSIPVFKTNRGGKITYHGEGQIIIYFMINLKKFFNPEEPDIAKFVVSLEELMIAGLKRIGLNCERNEVNHGAWVKNNKIGAIGIRLKKWISYHGLALNFNTNLDFYNYITPCGLDNTYGVTSVLNEMPDLKMQKSELIEILLEEIRKIFVKM